MQKTLLKSKIHRATVTNAELHYEGSCAIDENLLTIANIQEFEQIEIWNVNNGERFTTYALKAAAGSGIISVNGSAARKASVGDLVIIATFAIYDEKEAKKHKPSLVYVDNKNNPKELKNKIPKQQKSGKIVNLNQKGSI